MSLKTPFRVFPSRGRAREFTILEILIAIVVLVLGITGILALFPTAIDSGNKTVEDSYSAAITQSVVDAVAVGLRESRYSWTSPTTKTVWTYFIFNHDGVIDKAPDLPEELEGSGASGDQMWRKDYCIILPRSSVVGNNIDASKEPVFIYPVPNQNSGGDGADPDQRRPTNLDSGTVIDNFDPKYNNSFTVDDTEALWISRTYMLGRYREPTAPLTLPGSAQPGDVRLEYRGEDLAGVSTTAEEVALDPYSSYSFTFAIRRARVDTNGDGQVSPGPTTLQPSNPAADFFSNSLYELRVMIFKNFRPESANLLAPASSSGTPTGGAGLTCPKTNVPIKQFITLISI
jgi:hypothetical protein